MSLFLYVHRLQEERSYERSEYGYRVNDLQNQYEGRRASYEEGSEQLERGRVKQRFAAPQAVRGNYNQRQQQFDRYVFQSTKKLCKIVILAFMGDICENQQDKDWSPILGQANFAAIS